MWRRWLFWLKNDGKFGLKLPKLPKFWPKFGLKLPKLPKIWRKIQKKGSYMSPASLAFGMYGSTSRLAQRSHGWSFGRLVVTMPEIPCKTL